MHAQEAFIAALPADIGDLERSRGLYNLGCLYIGAGREDDADRALREATSLRPSLLEHALADDDLRPLWPRLVRA